MNLDHDAIWPPRDDLGRLEPHRINLITINRAIPLVMAAAFTGEVPPIMLADDVAEDGTPVTVIPCTCGEEVIVRLAATAECKCGRWFANFGSKVKVCRPPDAQERVAPAPES